MSTIHHGIDEKFLESSQADGKKFVIIFFMTNCQYCNEVFDETIRMYDSISKTGYDLMYMDLGDHLSVAEKYSIMKVPVWMVFHGDLIIERIDAYDKEFIQRIKLSVIFSDKLKEQ